MTEYLLPAKSPLMKPDSFCADKYFDSVHPGLMLEKLGLHAIFRHRNSNLKVADLKIHSPERPKKDEPGHDGDREFVLHAVRRAIELDTSFRSLYSAFYKNYIELLEKMGAEIFEETTKSRLVMGLSGGAAMQTGFTFHHTYGVPMIPGSSVKGACRAAAREHGMDEKEILGLYGSEDAKKPSGGSVIFLDAMPVPTDKEGEENPCLELDVLTPHHTKYYESNGKGAYANAPDVESPVPVMFVAVPTGRKFIFPILPVAGFAENWTTTKEKVEKHWKKACDLGFGGKTSSGYGWFKSEETKQ